MDHEFKVSIKPLKSFKPTEYAAELTDANAGDTICAFRVEARYANTVVLSAVVAAEQGDWPAVTITNLLISAQVITMANQPAIDAAEWAAAARDTTENMT